MRILFLLLAFLVYVPSVFGARVADFPVTGDLNPPTTFLYVLKNPNGDLANGASESLVSAEVLFSKIQADDFDWLAAYVSSHGDVVAAYKDAPSVISSLDNYLGGTGWRADMSNFDGLVAATPAVQANTAKVGITTDQANAIVTNSAKVSYPGDELTADEKAAISGANSPSALNPVATMSDVGSVGDVDSVNSQTGVVVLDADDIDDSTTANKFVTAAEKNQIANAVQVGDNVSELTNDAGYRTTDNDNQTASDVPFDNTAAQLTGSPTDTQSAVEAEVAARKAHEAASDPHSSYMREDNIGTSANNYIQLDLNGDLPFSIGFPAPDGTGNLATTDDTLEELAVAIDGLSVGGSAAEDTAYDVTWDGDTDPASKNALYDKIETLSAGSAPTIQGADPTSSSAVGFYGATISGDFFYKTSAGLFNISTGTYTADPTYPTLSSAAVDGSTLTLTWSENLSQGSGYADSQLNLDATSTGTDLGLTYSSGNGTATWIYTVASAIANGETVDLDFDGTTDSIEDSGGDDLQSIVSASVTNTTAAGASTVILRPSGDGYSSWDESEGTTHYELINDNSDTTYISTATNYEYIEGSLDDYSAGGTITDVTLHVRMYSTSGVSTTRVGFNVAGATAYYFTPTITNSVAEYTNSWAINPDTSLAWTDSDLDALEYYATARSLSGDTVYITDIWYVVTYE